MQLNIATKHNAKDTCSVDARYLEVIKQSYGLLTKRIIDIWLSNLSNHKNGSSSQGFQ